jgi:site-specific DNA-methyltransferase (adenine-specific)
MKELEPYLNKITCGDCLPILKSLPDKCVDLVLTDPPYGTTQCAWDTVIPFEDMWREIERVVKDDGAIVMTASQPFTTELIHSNISHFRHSWVWDKGLSGNIFLAETQPMKIHEDVLVFSKKTPRYFPIKTTGDDRKMRNNGMNDSAFGSFKEYEGESSDQRNPKSILYFPNTDRKNISHPTEKPITLFQYLLTTYSKENDIILDPFLGSGTTAVACKQLNRNFIGIEKEQKYCDIANERLSKMTQSLF